MPEPSKSRELESLWHPHSIAACAIGLATPFQLEWGGILYGSEILLALVALWALLTRLTDSRFWRPSFATLLAFLSVTILAYVVADLALGTEQPNLMRGWARPLFLGSNFVGLYFLTRRNPVNVLIYAASAAASALAFLAFTGRLTEDWKFGASGPITILLACLIPVPTRHGVLVGSFALIGAGAAHIALDSREIGGNCLLAGALLVARCSSVPRWRSVSWVVLGVLVAAGVSFFLTAYVLTYEEYGQRRLLSNAWRTASLITAADAIAESPWLGNGSQTNTFEFQSRYDAIFADRTGVRYRGRRTDTSTFSPHSQILQAWFEAGIFGTTFFLCLGWKLAGALHTCIFLRGLDGFSVLFGFCLLRAIWHLLFSPFAGMARLDVALAATIICLVDLERRRARARAR